MVVVTKICGKQIATNVMGFKLAYRMHMSEFKNENSSQQTACATLEIRTRQRLQFQLLTYNNDLASRTVLEDVVSPAQTTNPIVMPPHVIASSALLQSCVRNALTILDINAQVCEHAWPEIEKYVMKGVEAAQVAGVKSVWGSGCD